MISEEEIRERIEAEQAAFFQDPTEDRDARLARMTALRWVLGEV